MKTGMNRQVSSLFLTPTLLARAPKMGALVVSSHLADILVVTITMNTLSGDVGAEVRVTGHTQGAAGPLAT